jgi:acetyl esterase
MAASLNWIRKIVGPPPPGTHPPPPIADVESIPARRAAIDLGALNQDLPELAALHEHVILRERDGVALTAEVYVPQGKGPFPPMLYMHGGAFCVWSARDIRRIGVRLAAAGMLVVSLDYGLAPECPFPWAVEDTIYASRWLSRNAADYGGVAGAPIAIGGDSAGANLAAAAIAHLADGASGSNEQLDEGELAGVPVAFSAALLHCGSFDRRARMSERDTTPGTTEVMTCLAYLGTHFLAKQLDPMASPFFAANLDRFPPTYLSCGADDGLLPQTLRMTARLAEVDVPVTTSVVPEADHEFLLYDLDRPGIADEWERCLTWLREQVSVR